MSMSVLLYRAVKLTWLFLSVAVLVYSLYFNLRGWETLSVCYLTMGMLSFPAGSPTVRGVVYLLDRFGIPFVDPPGVALAPIFAVWSILFVVGWLQWFWLFPKLVVLVRTRLAGSGGAGEQRV